MIFWDSHARKKLLKKNIMTLCVACLLDCHDFEFVTDKADSNIIRGINKEELTKRSLMVDAVPSVFPGLVSYLCKDMPLK